MKTKLILTLTILALRRAVLAGYNNGPYNFRVGYNSERNIRGPIQNGFHDWDTRFTGVPRFEVRNIPDKFYGGYYTRNPYKLW